MANIMLAKVDKFPYCLRDRTQGEKYHHFKALAKSLFDNTLSMYFKGRPTARGIDFVDIIADTLSDGHNVSIQVKGLPGCAKNMLLQLAFYKMIEAFRSGESNALPIYLSSSYYEKKQYSPNNARAEMKELISEECADYFAYLKKNPSVKPVLMIEAVREHIVSKFAPEDVVMELWQDYGNFNRIVALDVGIIKNHLQLKRTIPIMGNSSGYTFKFHSVPITEKDACLSVIRTVLDMYIDKYEGLEALDVYNALIRLSFSTIDVFTVRLVATELSQGHSVDYTSLIDMYERMALNNLKGDDEKLLEVSEEIYRYIYDDSYVVKKAEYNASMWALPHMHNTYLEFLIAHYFCHCVSSSKGRCDFDFFRISMTEMENHFVYSRLYENYPLQKTLLNMILSNYDSFDVHQKSSSAYWLGKLSFAELTKPALELLLSEYTRLKPIVKTNNATSIENRYNQYLFRSVCLGLIAHGRSDILDEYLCLLVINDVANAINRGTSIQYVGDSYRFSNYNDFYLDTNPNLGEQTIRILCSRVERKMYSRRSGYIETNLVTLLTLVQARMHTMPENLSFNLAPYCERCLALLKEYQLRPRSIVSDKLLFYFQTVTDDLTKYLETTRFDAAFSLYSSLSESRNVKRTQWIEYGVDNPESIAEHSYNAWTLAMIFLPEEYDEPKYNKLEILNMLLIHDMAESIIGDVPSLLSEPTRDLKEQNRLLRKLFLKGTYPEVANMTHYYNVWTGYYTGQNINARIARDINTIQTACTFFDYFIKTPEKFSLDTVKKWLETENNLSTDLGYQLFERIVTRNPVYRKPVDRKFTESKQK